MGSMDPERATTGATKQEGVAIPEQDTTEKRLNLSRIHYHLAQGLGFIFSQKF